MKNNYYSLAEEFKLYEEMFETKKATTLNFTAEELDQALNNLTNDDEELFIGYNDQDRDVMFVGREPYSDTKWYVDKIADNLYIITSTLWGADGEGPVDGVEEEFESIQDLWSYILGLEQLYDMPNFK